YSYIRVTKTMAARRKRKKKSKRKIQFIPIIRNVYLRWSARIIGYFFMVTIGWVVLLCFINPPITWLMMQRGFERKSNGMEWKITKKWVRYNDLSDNLKRAAIAGEDARFMEHWGLD